MVTTPFTFVASVEVIELIGAKSILVDIDPDTFNIPQFATIDPLKWKENWKEDASKDIGIPDLVLGVAGSVTEASSKIIYLSFQQTIEDEQREMEEQLKLQQN